MNIHGIEAELVDLLGDGILVVYVWADPSG